MTLTTCVNDMMASACLALQLNPMLTQGQIEALEHHASDAIKALYLPKLISGEWNGTMNLTEPQAGIGCRRRCAPRPNRTDDGTYAITGQKIFITWGDNDFTANTCHLVLARLPDGAAGVKGISLFMVPKVHPRRQRQPRRAQHACRSSAWNTSWASTAARPPSCSMTAPQGWLVGEPHKGMAAMFIFNLNYKIEIAIAQKIRFTSFVRLNFDQHSGSAVRGKGEILRI